MSPDLWYFAVQQQDGTHVAVGGGANPAPEAAERDRRVALRQAGRRGGTAVKVEFFGRYLTGEVIWGQPVFAYRETRVTPLDRRDAPGGWPDWHPSSPEGRHPK